MTYIAHEEDLLGIPLREVQSRLDVAGNVVGTPYTVGYGHDDRGNEWLLHYPHGRHVKRTFDDLGRIVRWDNTDAAGTANGLIAQDTYAGAAARIEKRAFANGTETRFGYDTQRRMTESLTVRTATQAQIARVTSSWDPAGNKAARQDWQGQTATPWQSFDFGRDSLYRLASVTGMQGGAALPAMDYALDPAGNRDAVTQGAITTDYAFLSQGNAAVNQYGLIDTPGIEWFEELEWDAAGNLKSLEAYDDGRISHAESWTYNWRHQPTTFSRTVATSQLPPGTITYRYDALGRRIARVENGVETRFVYDGGRVIEERRGTDDSVLASYVHGAYIDDVVTMRRAVPQGGIPADWFFHSDDQFSVSAVTNAAGALAERVAYGDFGAPTFFTPGGTASVASAIGNPYAFTGRRWDAAERTYHYRFRTFSPGLGRFTTRDPIGIWGDALNLGNGYTYTGNDPWSWVDPWGLQGQGCPTRVSSSSVGDYPRNYLPPILGVPIGGIVDVLEGTGEIGLGVVTISPRKMNRGLHDIKDGLLGIVGLPEDIGEFDIAPTGTIPIPPSIKQRISCANATGREHALDARNGMHSWHCASNALITGKAGPVLVPLISIGGVAHEIADPRSMSAEARAQGSGAAAVDAVGDIVANHIGILIGLLVPPGIADVRSIAREAGSHIPGPIDTNPNGLLPANGGGSNCDTI